MSNVPKYLARRYVTKALIDAGQIVINGVLIKIASGKGNTGGIYALFVCPTCGEKKRKLYEPNYLCRKCAKIPYFREKNHVSTLLYHISKLEANPNTKPEDIKALKSLFHKLKRKVKNWS